MTGFTTFCTSVLMVLFGVSYWCFKGDLKGISRVFYIYLKDKVGTLILKKIAWVLQGSLIDVSWVCQARFKCVSFQMFFLRFFIGCFKRHFKGCFNQRVFNQKVFQSYLPMHSYISCAGVGNPLSLDPGPKGVSNL